MIDQNGHVLKRKEVEMDYILMSKDNTPFPLKLSNKLKMKEIEDLGFQDIGMIELNKNEDGTFEPHASNERIEEIKSKVSEFFNESEKDMKQSKLDNKKNPRYNFYYEKMEASQQDKDNLERIMRVDRALEKGEEIDDELFYQYLEEFPSYRKKLSKIQQFREKEKEAKIQEDEKMRHLEENLKASQMRQDEEYQRNYLLITIFYLF